MWSSELYTAPKLRETHWPIYRPPVRNRPSGQRVGQSLQKRKRSRNLSHLQAAADPSEEGAGPVVVVGAAPVGLLDEVREANGTR